MFTFHVTSARRTAVSIALVYTLAFGLGCPGGAATERTAPSVIGPQEPTRGIDALVIRDRRADDDQTADHSWR